MTDVGLKNILENIPDVSNLNEINISNNKLTSATLNNIYFYLKDYKLRIKKIIIKDNKIN